MSLNRIQIAGFKSIRSANLELRPLNVLIGANGSGKSNLVAVFELLRAIVEERLQVFVAQRGGASSLLHHGPKQTQAIDLKLHFGRNGYEASLSFAEGDALIFGAETCWFHNPKYSHPYRDRLGVGHKESLLREAAAKPRLTIADHARQAMTSWQPYHFHDTGRTAAVKQACKVDDNAKLRADAANLAAFLYRLHRTDAGHYRRIVAAIRQVAPFFEDFALRADPLGAGTMQLEWKEIGSDDFFNAHSLSDGTLRFACLATLLLQPQLPSLVLVDEPELGLHPYAIHQLASLLRSASTRTQVLIATQSVTLVNQFSAEDLIVVERENGASMFRRPDTGEIAAWLDGYSLGELWEKNILGGRPQSP